MKTKPVTSKLNIKATKNSLKIIAKPVTKKQLVKS
jgi:hypothetical protein